MKILLHSSKSMKPVESSIHALTKPQFLGQATRLNLALRKLSRKDLQKIMDISQTLASQVSDQIVDWSDKQQGFPAAITFRGDIYSGLSAINWTKSDADFAQENLIIMSGLYGLLKPFDAVQPYRLEMGYKFKTDNGLDLTKFWEQELLGKLDLNQDYINLTAKEYYKVIQKQLKRSKVIAPKFLTVSPKTGLPTFVTVHAKIARGSFANWLIKNKINDTNKILEYDQLNYVYDKSLSSDNEPVFVCSKFGGLGLSVRLK